MKARFFLANPKVDKCSLDAIVTHAVPVSLIDACQLTFSIPVFSLHRDTYALFIPHTGVIVNHNVKIWSGAIERAVRKMELENLSLNKKEFWMLVECEINGTQYFKRNSDITFLTDYVERAFIPHSMLLKSGTRIQRFNVVLAKLKDFERHSGNRYIFDDIKQEQFEGIIDRKIQQLNDTI